jgi:hypothetical protein
MLLLTLLFALFVSPLSFATLLMHLVNCANHAVPKFMVAEHNMQTVPPRLFFYDVVALRDYLHKNVLSLFGNNSNSQITSSDAGVVLLTQVKPDENGSMIPLYSLQEQTHWPVIPPASKVGEPKVLPVTHVGYAVTWYGMSVAGMVMMRILMNRGRPI